MENDSVPWRRPFCRALRQVKGYGGPSSLWDWNLSSALHSIKIRGRTTEGDILREGNRNIAGRGVVDPHHTAIGHWAPGEKGIKWSKDQLRERDLGGWGVRINWDRSGATDSGKCKI